MEKCDIAIVGAGIAGASLAAQLAGHGSVMVLEAEDSPGYHTTGRSAAFWNETYGGTGVQPLTTASGPFLRDGGFLHRREALTIARSDQEAQVDEFIGRFTNLGVRLERVERNRLERYIPGLLPGWTCGALEPECSDIDVAALHQHYLATARKAGANIEVRSMLVEARREQAGWTLKLRDGRQLRCAVLANAAGAWADPVAEMAGVAGLGIQPLRRTMVQLDVEPPAPVELPLVIDIAENFYFKPESGGLWVSPHDETPSSPCDAAPEEIDVAIAIDRLEHVVDWRIEKVSHSWAGLRSFAPDRLPVYGFDPEVPNFFWFAGQGGFGIQTAPAAARLAAGLILGEADGEIDPASYSPARFH